jgi:hypothetical protein
VSITPNPGGWVSSIATYYKNNYAADDACAIFYEATPVALVFSLKRHLKTRFYG